jgi:hypothetical protein
MPPEPKRIQAKTALSPQPKLKTGTVSKAGPAGPAAPIPETVRLALTLLMASVGLFAAYALFEYGAASLFSSAGPLFSTLDYATLHSLAWVCLRCGMVSGVLGGGVYVTADFRPSRTIDDERALRWAVRVWWVVVVCSLAAAVFQLAPDRPQVWVPAWVDLGAVLAIAGVLRALWPSRPASAIFEVWAVGVGCMLLGLVSGLIPPTDFAHARVLGLVSLSLRDTLGVLVTLLPLAYWLLHRVSNITPAWMETSAYAGGALGLLAAAGAAIGGFNTGFRDDAAVSVSAGLWGVVSLFSACIIAISLLILGAHAYRALSDRNPARTLAAHWVAWALIMLLAGGFFQAMALAPESAPFFSGTHLAALGPNAWALASIALFLGLFNQVAAETDRSRPRITGLVPYWLFVFGSIGIVASLMLIGTVQVYLRGGFGMTHAESEAMLRFFYGMWSGSLGLVVLGLLVYAAVMLVRSPLRARKPAAAPTPASGLTIVKR